MGAGTDMAVMRGENATDAFHTLKQEIIDDLLTHSIAGKKQIKMFKLPKGKEAEEYARELLNNDDDLRNARYGPVGCIKIRDGEFLFFAWVRN